MSLTSSRGTRWNVVSKKKKKARGSIINDLGEIQGFLGTVLFNLVVSVLQLRKSSSLQWLRCLSIHQSLIRLLISGDPRLTWWQALPLTLQFAACNILEGNGPRVCFPWLTSSGFFFFFCYESKDYSFPKCAVSSSHSHSCWDPNHVTPVQQGNRAVYKNLSCIMPLPSQCRFLEHRGNIVLVSIFPTPVAISMLMSTLFFSDV